MEKLTKALMTDETGQAIVGKLIALSGQMRELAMATRGSAILFESESDISVLGDGGYLTVYVGTTNPLVVSGWTGDNSLVTGHLYYLMKSGTAVASRDLGEYGGSAVTDTTLGLPNVPADSETVGLKLALKANTNDVDANIGDLSQLTTTAKNNLVSAINEAAANAEAEGDTLAELNVRLEQLDSFSREWSVEEAKTASVSVTSGTAVGGATLHLIDVNIPTGKEFTFIIDGESGILTNYALYANGSRIHLNCNFGTKYTFTASSDITYISIYASPSAATSTGTVNAILEVVAYNENSLEAQIKNISSDIIDTFTYPVSLSTSDLEDGALRNGTGEEFYTSGRVRTSIYIPVEAGTIIKSANNINVWEFNLNDKTYLTDAQGWVKTYTVTTDCFIRIMWSNLSGGAEKTYQELIDTTTFSFLRQIRSVLLNNNYIKSVCEDVAKENVFANIPSSIVRSIAHRGDNIEGPQCTAPAYILARKKGFTVAENDLWLSEDGEFVMWHDTNLAKLGNMVDINGYLMYTDGTDYYWVHPTTNAVYTWNGSAYVASSVALSGLDRCNGTNYGVNSQYSVTGLPLSVLKRIDFGVYKGAKFAGTQILTFAEWVLLCKQLGMEIYIDRKLTYTTELITQAANIVKRYGMGGHASWLGLYASQITFLRTIIPDSRCGILQHPTAETAQSYQQYNIGRGFFFNGDAKNGMTAEAIRYGLDAGFEVEVWYVDIPSLTAEQVYETIRTAVSYGVTGMTLDHYRVDDAFKSLIESY